MFTIKSLSVETCRCDFPTEMWRRLWLDRGTAPLAWPAAFCIVSLKQKDTTFSSDELKTLKCIESGFYRHHIHNCEIKNRPQEHHSVLRHLHTQSGRQDTWIPNLQKTQNRKSRSLKIPSNHLKFIGFKPLSSVRSTLDISQVLCGLWIQGFCPNRTLLRKVVPVSRVMCSI